MTCATARVNGLVNQKGYLFFPNPSRHRFSSSLPNMGDFYPKSALPCLVS